MSSGEHRDEAQPQGRGILLPKPGPRPWPPAVEHQPSLTPLSSPLSAVRCEHRYVEKQQGLGSPTALFSRKKKNAGCRTHPVACRVCSSSQTHSSTSNSCLQRAARRAFKQLPWQEGMDAHPETPRQRGSFCCCKGTSQLLTCKNCRWLGAIWLSHIITDVARGVARRTEAFHI